MQKTLISLVLMLAVFALVAISIKALQTRATAPPCQSADCKP